MSDTVMYVILSSAGISIEGDYLPDIINVHCSSGSVIYLLISSSNNESMSTTSSRVSSSRNLGKFVEKRFSDVKLIPLGNEQDSQHLLKKLTEQKLTKPTETCLRPYLFAQFFSYLNPNVIIYLLFIKDFLIEIVLVVN